ncbi:hypothetical protein MBELCI_2424 [Limimaricola cinnabarinus LL-001]|uniref:Uncharacterized protein n=1 Tax=Limimaricola cinnabarinus LL-001 TaxID=1337093 RepID=U2Z5Q3_9RHOB|nr:hypothetical protein MBELCI_2424 [Limimaricola cinnabarinus LL-001]
MAGERGIGRGGLGVGHAVHIGIRRWPCNLVIPAPHAKLSTVSGDKDVGRAGTAGISCG